ncbi:DUF2877 domain-containing protein [Mesobacterium pallidum]|uniref:oxamate carbamoyltransferase subunit AllH family protein n=1 Tax=Mesobacterium pallidum TaxID=2872037 RepID=UPI001EE3130D|nr:DUF2877 domain-containing protein [Mesobacterium pallidum]
MRRLIAHQAGTLALQALDVGTLRARVVAVFPRHVYLDTSAGLLIVTPGDEPPGPLNLSFDDWPSLNVGDDVALEAGAARHWPSSLPRRDLSALWLDGLEAQARAIPHASAPLSSILERRDLPGGQKLAEGLRKADPVAAGQGARALAGLGPGLTPAGDDVLCGVLLALYVTQRATALCPEIVAASEGMTTALSYAFIRAAGLGHAGAAWHDLLVGAEAPHAEDTAAVMAHGHSSGADTLAGFLWAARLTAPDAAADRPAG